MHRDSQGSINWSAVAALAASLAAVLALGTTLLVVRTVRQDSQRILYSTALDALWRLDEQWNSEGMGEARGAAATALLDGHPTQDVDAVLDFFDHVALLVQRGALDEEMVWYQFYWPMANYWTASREYIRAAQHDDVTMWQDLDTLMPRLVSIEAQRHRRRNDEVLPTAAQVRDFLTDESEGDECTEDEDPKTRKLPL